MVIPIWSAAIFVRSCWACVRSWYLQCWRKYLRWIPARYTFHGCIIPICEYLWWLGETRSRRPQAPQVCSSSERCSGCHLRIACCTTISLRTPWMKLNKHLWLRNRHSHLPWLPRHLPFWAGIVEIVFRFNEGLSSSGNQVIEHLDVPQSLSEVGPKIFFTDWNVAITRQWLNWPWRRTPQIRCWVPLKRSFFLLGDSRPTQLHNYKLVLWGDWLINRFINRTNKQRPNG